MMSLAISCILLLLTFFLISRVALPHDKPGNKLSVISCGKGLVRFIVLSSCG